MATTDEEILRPTDRHAARPRTDPSVQVNLDRSANGRISDGASHVTPRGPSESIDDYLDRVRAFVLGTDGHGGPTDQRSESEEERAVTPDAMEPTRGEHESFSDYFERIERELTRGLHPRELGEWEDSVDIIRQSREERTAALLRASGMVEDEAEPPAPRGEGEPLMDYLARVTAYVVGDQVFEDDSAMLVRQGRQERTVEVLGAIERGRAQP